MDDIPTVQEALRKRLEEIENSIEAIQFMVNEAYQDGPAQTQPTDAVPFYIALDKRVRQTYKNLANVIMVVWTQLTYEQQCDVKREKTEGYDDKLRRASGYG
jgi:hypothetical protein